MFYLQHGHGKSTKIEDCVAEGNVHGVILSPGNEDVATLIQTSRKADASGLRVLIDPQSYVYATVPQGQMRFHNSQGLAFTNMHWALSATELVDLVSAVEVTNRNAGVQQPWICPAPFHRNLSDYWMPTAIQFARTARERWGNGVIVTVAIDESILSEWGRIADWLDVLTTLDVAGFYLLVSRRSPIYPPAPWPPADLANLLRLIYVLSIVNEYELIWGYSDVDGLLGIAAGATAVASGWSYGLRQFSVERYNVQRAGGAPAVPRVYVPDLLSDLRNNEAEDIYRRLPNGANIFSAPVRTQFANRDFASLSNPEAQTLHLTGLARDVGYLAGLSSLRERLDTVESRVNRALLGLEQIKNTGLTLEPRYANRLLSYRDGLIAFRASVAL